MHAVVDRSRFRGGTNLTADFYVGVTNNDWYGYLAAARAPEVNFWSPTATPFKVIPRGGLFLFKLHAPTNYIVGGGFLAGSMALGVRQAWEWFGQTNGCEDFATFRRILRNATPGQQITCTLLGDVFYWPQKEWIPTPPSFRPNIVRGRGYTQAEDPAFWNAVSLRLRVRPVLEEGGGGERYGAPQMVLPRLGQGLFRGVVAEAYGKRCVVTGERVLPALEAAHIVPYAQGGTHTLENGLLLRSDLHRLFDQGYLTVDPDTRQLVVSRRMQEEFHNGRAYFGLEGTPIASPAQGFPPPSKENLVYHAQHIYVA